MIIDYSSRQRNFSQWVNTKEFIVLHHTWVIGEWNIPVLLWERAAQVSAHYILMQDGRVVKLGWDNQVLWHAWDSEWKWKKYLNWYSIWIEVEWPTFTKAQRRELRQLVRNLMAAHNIPKENVIRHKDIAPWRKTDPDDSLFWLSWFSLWRFILSPKLYDIQPR